LTLFLSSLLAPSPIRADEAERRKQQERFTENIVAESLVFSPDGTRLAVGYYRYPQTESQRDWAKWVRTWDLGTGDTQSYGLFGTPIAFRPDGRLVAAYVPPHGRGHEGGLPPTSPKLEEVRSNRPESKEVGLEGMAASPDGRWVRGMAASPDGRWVIWVSPETVPRTGERGLWVSPGMMPGTGERGLLVALYDAATGQLRHRLREYPPEQNQVLNWLRQAPFAFSGDGKLVALIEAHVVQFWETESGKPRGMVKTDARLVALSPNGAFLAAADWNGTVKLAQLPEGPIRVPVDPPRDPLDEVRAEVRHMAFSPDGATLAVASATIKSTGSVRELGNRVEFYDVNSGHRRSVIQTAADRVAFSPDGKRLATADRGEVVRIWAVATGQKLATLERREGQVRCLAFSPDGRLLATGGFDEDPHWLYPPQYPADTAVKLWDVATGRLARNLQGHERPVWCLAFSPDGKMLASSDYRTLRIWGVPSGKSRLADRGLRLTAPVRFSPDGRTLAAMGEGGIVFLDPATAEKQGQLGGKDLDLEQGSYLYGFLFPPDGRRLICGSFANTGNCAILLCNLSEKRVVKRIPAGSGRIELLASSPDGLRVVAKVDKGVDHGRVTETVAVWDQATGRQIHVLARNTTASFQRHTAAFSPDGRTLALSLPDGTLQFRDAAGFNLGKTILVRDVSQIAFSPDGNLLATCGRDNAAARLWSPRTGELIRAIFLPGR